MKTAISLPDEIFRDAERAARRLKLTRSQLYRRALAAFLEREKASDITEALDAVYAQEPSGLDPALAVAQWASLPAERWP